MEMLYNLYIFKTYYVCVCVHARMLVRVCAHIPVTDHKYGCQRTAL